MAVVAVIVWGQPPLPVVLSPPLYVPGKQHSSELSRPTVDHVDGGGSPGIGLAHNDLQYQTGKSHRKLARE